MYWLLATIYPVDGSNGNSYENLENSRHQSLMLILVNLGQSLLSIFLNFEISGQIRKIVQL